MGYRVQGKSLEAMDDLLADALSLEAAGAIAIVLECNPREVATQHHITAALGIPTIGIGAGPECDGQILVIHDLVNLSGASPKRNIRQSSFASTSDVGALITEAIANYLRRCLRAQLPLRRRELSPSPRDGRSFGPTRRRLIASTQRILNLSF